MSEPARTAPARGHQGRRRGVALRRARDRDDAGRLRRRRHQDRAPARRQPPHARAGRRTASRSGGRWSGATSARSRSNLSDPEGQELAKRLLDGRRRLHRELPPRHARALGPRARRPARDQPGPRDRPDAAGSARPARTATLPGFGTLAESISGYAHINGWPDGPPTLPPFALGDGVASLTGAFAAMFALWWREHAGEGKGQVIDLAIYEPLFWILGPQALVYDQLGIVQGRTGNAAPFTAPRNAYQAKDGRWLGLSGERAVDRRARDAARRARGPDRGAVVPRPHRPGGARRRARRDHPGLDRPSARPRRCSPRSPSTTPRSRRSTRSPTSSRIRSYRARETITTVEHPKLGPLKMQNVIPTLSETPGRIEHPGPELGEHNDAIYVAELGLSEEELERLQAEGVI